MQNFDDYQGGKFETSAEGAVRVTFASKRNSLRGESAVSTIKRLSLYEFILWDRGLVSVVRIRESPYTYYRGFFEEKI